MFLDHIYKFDVISFDVFDTLIVRDTDCPHDVFSYMEQSLVEKYGHYYDNFRLKRITAEKLSLKKGGVVSLDEIYQVFYEQYGENDVDLQKLEIQYEKKLTVARVDILEVYLECLRRGKKILIITDMYLLRSTIENILSQNGIYGYTGLYISGESGATKRSGKLYQYVCEEEHLNKKAWIHVGDNFVSDYLQARIFGIQACHIPLRKRVMSQFARNGNKESSFFSKGLASFVSNRAIAIGNPYQKIGYSLYGPFLYGIIRWLERSIKDDRIDTMLLLSRDGFLFQRAYREIMGRRGIKYFLVSRKSLIRPFLATYPTYTLFFQVVIQGFPGSFSIRDFLKKLDVVPCQEMDILIRKYGFTYYSVLEPSKLRDDENFQALYAELLQLLHTENQTALSAFKKYLNQCGIYSGKKIALFDVGWRGSIQFLLEHILGYSIYGYYLFIDSTVFRLSHTKGFLAESYREVYSNSGYTSLLELVFSAPHGSVSGYDLENGIAKVRFSRYEHEDEKEEAGLIALREGALACNRELFSHPIYGQLVLSNQEYVAFLKQAGENPTRWLVKIFDIFCFEDNEKSPLIGGGSVIQGLAHPKMFVRAFMRSSWKIGFLRKYIPLPLGSLFLAIKNAIVFNRMR